MLAYLKKKGQNSEAVFVLRRFVPIGVITIAMHDVHLHRVPSAGKFGKRFFFLTLRRRLPDVVYDVFAPFVVPCSPVKMQILHLVFAISEKSSGQKRVIPGSRIFTGKQLDFGKEKRYLICGARLRRST